MSDPLRIQKYSVEEILIRAMSVPISLPSVEEERCVVAESLQLVGKVQKRVTFVLLTDKVKAYDEFRIGSLCLFIRLDVFVECLLRYSSVGRVDDLGADKAWMFFCEAKNREGFF